MKRNLEVKKMVTHSSATTPEYTGNLYDRDYYLWLETTAQFLRDGKLNELDLPNLIEERDLAATETGLSIEIFPAESPFTPERISEKFYRLVCCSFLPPQPPNFGGGE